MREVNLIQAKCSNCGKELDRSDIWGYCPDCLKSLNRELFDNNSKDYSKNYPKENNPIMLIMTYIMGAISFLLFFLYLPEIKVSEGMAVFLYLAAVPSIVMAVLNVISCAVAAKNSDDGKAYILPIIPSLLLLTIIAYDFITGK